MGQTQIEIEHFLQFLKLQGLNVDFKQCPEPQPDFEIILNGRSIGIEHTRLFLQADSNGNDPTKHKASANRIVENAEKMFKKNRTEKLTVTVNFVGTYGLTANAQMLTGKDIQRLSKFLYEFVNSNIPAYGGRLRFEQFDMSLGEKILPEEIDYLSIDHKYDCWTQSEGGMVPDIQGEALNLIISKKEPKVLNYRSSFDEVWLLIVEDQWNLLNYFDFSYADSIMINSRFNRVFIMRSGNNEVRECINISPVFDRWNSKSSLD